MICMGSQDAVPLGIYFPVVTGLLNIVFFQRDERTRNFAAEYYGH